MSDISAIKLPDNSSHNIKAKKLFYAECSTAVNVVAKVISCDGFVLEPGAVIAIRFTDTTTTAPTSGNITLNINGTGAKNIVPKENNAVYNYAWAWYFSNNRTWLFVYNGTYFICLNQDNNNVNPEAFGIGYATCSTAETTSAKVAVFSGYVLRKNGIIAVKFTYAVPANSTLNINRKGAKNIFYRGAKITAGVINAGDIATFVYDGTQYQLISVDADYARKTDLPSIDTALSATSTNPVQNKVINSALAGKAAASHSHTISQISDFPASLPANGGNANTVGGKAASDFLQIADQMQFNNIAIEKDIHGIRDVDRHWRLWSDNEGGNFEIGSPDLSRFIQMDCFDNNTFRIYSWRDSVYWGILEANHVTGEITLGNRRVSDFASRYGGPLPQYLNGQSGDIRALVYQLPIGGYIFNTTDAAINGISFPMSGDCVMFWAPVNNPANNYIYGMLIIRSMVTAGATYICSVYNTSSYTDWQSTGADTSINTGEIRNISEGTTYTMSLPFTPVAVLFFDLSYNHSVNNGFSLSLVTNGFVFKPASISAMGATSVRYVAFRG